MNPQVVLQLESLLEQSTEKSHDRLKEPIMDLGNVTMVLDPRKMKRKEKSAQRLEREERGFHGNHYAAVGTPRELCVSYRVMMSERGGTKISTDFDLG